VVLRLPPELRSVRQARADLARIASQWGCPEELVQDARVVLSELMSNGVLHARTELQVFISSPPGGGLRVEVHDASSLPVLPPVGSLPVRPPAELPDAARSLLDEPASLVGPHALLVPPTATGRGLALVSALASAWGWFAEVAGGKVVWAELGTRASRPLGWQQTYADRPVHLLRPVRLIALPLRLVKGSEDHFDDLFRELQMTRLAAAAPTRAPGTDGALDAADAGEQVAVQLAPLAENVKSALARLREPVRRAIWEATRRGDRLVDLDVLADTATPGVLQMSEELLSRSAQAAREGLLLTEPPTREVVAWRRWLRAEMEAQIAGRPPRACPFPVAPRHGEDRGPARERLDAARRDALVELRSILDAGSSAGEGFSPLAAGFAGDPVSTALARVLAYVGARRCVVCLLADDNETVTFGPSVGFSPAVAQYWQNYSLSADLPASEAIRTARPLFFRTFSELNERYPIFLSTPSENDPCLACVPLLTERSAAFGCIVFGFAHARDFGHGEISFLRHLAGEVGNFMGDERRYEAHRAAARLRQSLDEACSRVNAASTKRHVLTEVVEAVFRDISDGAAVHAVVRGGAVRYALSRHRDPERERVWAELLQRQQRRGHPDQMVTECARSGQPAVVQVMSHGAIAVAVPDNEDAQLLRKLAVGSLGVIPVSARGQVAAVVTMVNDAGRFISDEDLGAVQRLADEAGAALARLGNDGTQ
jgi:hypothetical protein